MAVKKATSEGRPVTARDAEEAVKELNIPSGNGAEQESAQEILGEVAEKFSELETTMKSALNRCPGKKAVILSMVRKVKSDLKRWAEAEGRDEPGAEGFWLTPPETYAALNAQYGPFDFDPCPHPRPKGFNSLNIPWGRRNYVNPPFHPHDGVDGQGPTAFVRKAIAEQRLGKTSVLTLPVQSYVNLLLEAGAELRSLGRVRWRESTTGEPMRGPSPICCFVLRGGRTPPPGPTGPRR
jgi:hypothetical protein